MRNFLAPILFFALISTLLFVGCGKGSQGYSSETIEIDLNDEVVQQIHNYSAKRSGKDLILFLGHENPAYRLTAAQCLASVQDENAVGELSKLLRDEYPEIRKASAFALGQLRSPKSVNALLEAFREFKSDSLLEYIRPVQASILEAVGKCGDAKLLSQLSKAPNYNYEDSPILEGQMRGIYQFGLRDTILLEGTRRAMELITKVNVQPSVRFWAAQYLYRNKEIDLTKYDSTLAAQCRLENLPKVRMLLVVALAKTKSQKAVDAFKKLYQLEQDYRVKVNMARGMKYLSHDSIKVLALEMLKDQNNSVKQATAEFFEQNATDSDVLELQAAAEACGHWRTRATLYGAALKACSPMRSVTLNGLNNAIINRFNSSQDKYEKALLLEALSGFGWNYEFLRKQIFPDSTQPKSHAVVSTAAMKGISNIMSRPNLSTMFGMSGFRVRSELNDLVMKCATSGDAGLCTIASELIANPALNFKQYFADATPLQNALKKLSLPKDLEAAIALNSAINTLTGGKNPTPKAPKTPIMDWASLNKLPQAASAIVRTTKGNFVFKLWPKTAPATVTLFAKLAKQGFYNDKAFHRVVPNFVAQTGCDRGDGYGGIAESLTSEFSETLWDREGIIGMASAGKDSEGSQWFITHSATPHLQGKYTAFGEITEGMEVVHKLEVGDKIISLEIR